MKFSDLIKSNLLITSAVLGLIGKDLQARNPVRLHEENLTGGLTKLMHIPTEPSQRDADIFSKDDKTLLAQILKSNPTVLEKASGHQVISSPSKRKGLATSQEIHKAIQKKSNLTSPEHAEKLENLAKDLQLKYNGRPFQITRKVQEVGDKLTVRTRAAFSSLAASICDSIENEVSKLLATDFKMLSVSEASEKGEEITALQMHLNNSSQGFDALVSAFDDKGGNNTLFRKILANYRPIETLDVDVNVPQSRWTRFKNWVMSPLFG